MFTETARRRRAPIASFFFASCAATVASTASAQNFADVYVGSFTDDVKPIVVFAFDDPRTEGFNPVDIIAVYPNTEYDWSRTTPVQPTQACIFTLDFNAPPGLEVEYESQPIYGPSSGREPINYPDLPTFFAQQGLRVLVAREQVGEQTAAFAQYATCVGYVWALNLSQPAEFWENLLQENLGRGIVPPALLRRIEEERRRQEQEQQEEGGEQ